MFVWECVRPDAEPEAAQLLFDPASPQSSSLGRFVTSARRVVDRPVHGAHLRELADDVDEVAVLEALARPSHELHERLAGVAPFANDEVAQIAGAVGLRVRREPFLAPPVANRIAEVVAEVGGEPALLELEHLIPAAGPVQAERRTGRRLRERVLHLVAVVEDLGLDDRSPERRLGDARDGWNASRTWDCFCASCALYSRSWKWQPPHWKCAHGVDALRTRSDDFGGERLRERLTFVTRANAIAGQATARRRRTRPGGPRRCRRTRDSTSVRARS